MRHGDVIQQRDVVQRASVPCRNGGLLVRHRG